MLNENFVAWVIYAESPGSAPRTTDDAFFPWEWGEVIAILPPDATAPERAAALSAVVQASHFASRESDDLLQFAQRGSYLSRQARDQYFDALHPYIAVRKASALHYDLPAEGEARGRIRFEPAD
ncbi:hypothetical protein [Microbacterium sp.]|uniref:hypothetical protein n=1 Tax=Microbacterium sp. TaxID=51671 RepID=UPI003A8E6DB4